MWIVRIALRRPYTFIVMALLILLATPFALLRTPVDIFPDIDIPVISIMWSFNGLSAKEMADRIVTPAERFLTTTTSDIEHVESQTVAGMGIIKVFFHETANIQTALAQIVSNVPSTLRSLPPGTTPPLVLKYSASNVPILQVGLGSPSLSDQELSDLAFNALRMKLITIPGVAVPFPYGGRFRQVSVDLDVSALLAKGLTPVDVANAVGLQNLTLPTGTAKIGATEYNISLNGSPATMAQLNDIPVKTSAGTTIYLKDVAQVHDGAMPQTNIVRQNGTHGVLMSVLKNGAASTLQIVQDVLTTLPAVAKTLPEDLQLKPMFDQSLFVKAAVKSVVVEALIAACLTAAMLLLFLGNWRSTCIIAVSIPLSILSSILLLHLFGQTLNLMTLGGLALAVGILVDDATVEIENIERNLHLGKDTRTAILDGAAEIAVPAFVSTLCICIVFLPMFFLTGVARFLFVPMAEAVVFAMLASYLLSRTLVPTMVLYLMPHKRLGSKGVFSRINHLFEIGFEAFRTHYSIVLAALLRHRKMFGSTFLLFCLASIGLFQVLGSDFFPAVDAGQIKLHFRAPSGTRIEQMPKLADEIEAVIRQTIPSEDLQTLLDNLGGPYTPVNTAYNNSGTIDTADAEIMVSLKPGTHAPTATYVEALRSALPSRFPGVEFFFQPADMVSQSLNFGVPSVIDVQFSGAKTPENLKLAVGLVNAIKQIPGAVDVHLFQRFNKPSLDLEMDRNRLQQVGLLARDVAQNLLISLSSSFQTAPTFWLNPVNGVVYNLGVQSRQHEVDSIDALMRTPIGKDGKGDAQLLGNLVQYHPQTQQAVVSRYGNVPVIDIYAGVQGRDLGSVAADIDKLVDATRAKLPRGSDIAVRGQVQTMRTSMRGLGLGLAVAIVLVYLLIVVNFQSWLDPFIIVAALPAALAGIAWTLFLTGTTLSVPALTGAIMTMGVATANSILVVSFAREKLDAGVSAVDAALVAGSTRLRPVLMTALAMMIGMVPMAAGIGEAAEQNAPLGRAVIGGLLFATLSTLLFVPVLFASLHQVRGQLVIFPHTIPAVTGER